MGSNLGTLDDGFGHWLAGFIDGEGCFIIAPHGEPRSDYLRYKPAFTLKLRDDDADVLHEIVERTGLGTVHLIAARKGAPLREMPQAAWHVVRKAHCAALVRLLDEYPLRAKKARDYAIWRQAVVEWGRVEYAGQRRHDWSRMAALKAALESGRRYSGGVIDTDAEVAIAVAEQLVLMEVE